MKRAFVLQDALDLRDHLCAEVGAVRVELPDAVRSAAGTLFDVGTALGVGGLPDGSTWRARFGFALGPLVFPAASIVASVDPAAIVNHYAHECHHTHQWHTAYSKTERRDGLPWPSEVAMAWLYLAEQEARARLEADAYGVGAYACVRAGGSVPRDPRAWAPSLATSYRLDAAHAEMGYDQLAAHLEVVADGGCPNLSTAVVVRDWCDARGL